MFSKSSAVLGIYVPYQLSAHCASSIFVFRVWAGCSRALELKIRMLSGVVGLDRVRHGLARHQHDVLFSWSLGVHGGTTHDHVVWVGELQRSKGCVDAQLWYQTVPLRLHTWCILKIYLVGSLRPQASTNLQIVHSEEFLVIKAASYQGLSHRCKLFCSCFTENRSTLDAIKGRCFSLAGRFEH